MVDSRASPRLASPPSVIAAEERKRHREGQGEAVGAAAPGRSNEQGSKDRAPKRPRVAKVPLAQVPYDSALLALQKRRGGGSASSSTSHSFGPASNRCGTPGCTLPDFHEGLCSTEQALGRRKRPAPGAMAPMRAGGSERGGGRKKHDRIRSDDVGVSRDDDARHGDVAESDADARHGDVVASDHCWWASARSPSPSAPAATAEARRDCAIPSALATVEESMEMDADTASASALAAPTALCPCPASSPRYQGFLVRNSD